MFFFKKNDTFFSIWQTANLKYLSIVLKNIFLKLTNSFIFQIKG